MKSFLFLLTLPTPTVQEVAQMDSRARQRAKVRRVLQENRAGIMRMLEDTVLDQINNPRELASLHQGPGGSSAQIVTRSKPSVDDLPEVE